MKKTVLLLAVLLLVCCETGPRECVIIGEVVDRPESGIIGLMARDENAQLSDYIKIPLVDGRFTAKIPADTPELMTLVFEDEVDEGSWWPIEFINEADTVRFKLYPMERRAENVVTGGKLNRRLKFLKEEPDRLFPIDSLMRLIDTLYARDLAENAQAKELSRELKNCTDPKERDKLYAKRDTMSLYTPQYKDIMAKVDSRRFHDQTVWLAHEVRNEQSEAELAVLSERIAEVVTYDQRIDNFEELVDIYEQLFREKFATNPMAAKTDLLLDSRNIKVGGRYLDLKAPDFEGNMVAISDEIDGKFAVIDMWASWCSPCIRNSTALIPIYEKYKDRGFTVIGIAREKGSPDAATKVVKDHQFPWKTLLEIDNANKIWYRYGISNAAGAVYLVDKKGEIMLINPHMEQIEAVLQKELQ